MVGHTGSLLSATMAMEAVDLSLGRLLKGLADRHATVVILADHGNCEEMVERDKKTGGLKKDKNGRFIPKTSHTTNPVPCFIVGPGAGERYRWAAPEKAGLANVAATCLLLLGLTPPPGFLPPLIAPV
jgi:2,3-bisphosphoglycerate-independent phosphoglycerate mutase